MVDSLHVEAFKSASLLAGAIHPNSNNYLFLERDEILKTVINPYGSHVVKVTATFSLFLLEIGPNFVRKSKTWSKGNFVKK